MPVVGLGSWITFNVGNDPVARDACAAVMLAFVEAGGRMIDSSPMYGSSQEVIGYGLRKQGLARRVFAADKVWISSGARGREQIERSRRNWQVDRLDLVQVHNLLAWEEHLPTLFAMKAAGQIRYVGITTSEGRRHRDIEHVMAKHPLDFVQVTYNPADREVEERILPLARDRGIARDRQPAVSRRRPGQGLGATAPSAVGRRGRLRELGRARAEVHRLASGRDLRDPGDHAGRSRAGEHARGDGAHAGRGDAQAHRRRGGARLMSEWWTYTLSDFLLFSPRTYYRTLELYNLAIWPAQIAGVAIGLAIVALLATSRGGNGRVVAALLALCWLFIAWAFHYERYAQINWAAPWFAAAFALQGVLFAAVGVIAGRMVVEPAASGASRVAIALAGAVVVLYPLLAPLTGRPWTTAETFGVAPDPTAIATIATLALVRGRIKWLLLVVPVLWCAVAALTLVAIWNASP